MILDTISAFARLSLQGKPMSAFPIDKLISVPGAQPLHNVIDIFKLIITEQMVQLTKATPELVYSSIDTPKNLDVSDLVIATPRLRIKGNPVQLSQQYTSEFLSNEYIVGVTASGPFMNFRINHDILKTLTLARIYELGDKYGHNESGKGKRAVVEFSSPNIAKPFHAGHLRSTIIGNFTRNGLKANGWDTVAINYLGDWGKQYGLLAVGYEKHGHEAKLESDPIRHLFDVYVQIVKDADADPTIHDEARAYFKRMETGDVTALALWQRFRDLSINKYREIYKRLNIDFDVYSGESQVSKEMDAAMITLNAKQLLQHNDGAEIIDLKAHKLGVVVVQKSDGTTLYITRDIGAAKGRFDTYGFDAMYYVVGAQQDLHFRQLFKVLSLMDYEWAPRCSHINFGMVNGMSTRKGNVVFLEDILDQTKEVMLDVMKKNETKYAQLSNPDEIADLVGLSAIVVQDMSARRVKDYDFAWDRMFSFEGDTGPYLQYAHARLCSIERKANMADFPPKSLDDVDLSLLTEPAIRPVIQLLAMYSDMIAQLPIHKYEPSNVTTYLFRLCHAVSSSYESLMVLNQEEPVKRARLFFYWCARVVLGNSLRMIGLRPLERM